ncbi:MAG TPA: hypothetical protein VH722_15375, partial [Alphaproteobacteria bacterium]|nr:hypothetical protein [Alphaproteobacteria bacterium]
MSIADDVKSALAEFETENPTLAGKAYLTSGSRSVEEQIEIILDPKRADNYLHIKERFKSIYKLTSLPVRADLTEPQLSWWEDEVKKQAGQSPGFPHVGGYAQDVSVKNLDTDGKEKLKKKFESKKISILMEKVTGTESEYGVSLENAN